MNWLYAFRRLIFCPAVRVDLPRLGSTFMALYITAVDSVRFANISL